MRLLGLTGDIACGKSTVAALLKARGASHLDSDLLVRELYGSGEFATSLAARFGDVLAEDGSVDRAKLGRIVFNDAARLSALEALVHPAVAALRVQKLAELEQQGAQYVVIEAVKLLESGQGRVCEEIWCVVASPAVQTRRLLENRGLSATEAATRLSAQPSRADKMNLAKPVPLYFLENDGTLAELETQVAILWNRFISAT